MIRKLCAQLDIGPAELGSFSATEGPLNYNELSLDTFTAISEWYHDAILELTRIKGFRPEPKVIAKQLGITVMEVHAAIERLQRLELLEITKSGKGEIWTDISGDNHTSLAPDFTSAALRKYQKKVLELSLNALETVPRTEREHVSNMLAVRKSDLPKVKKEIDSFRWTLTRFLQRRGSEPDDVYQLAISFFPILKPSRQ